MTNVPAAEGVFTYWGEKTVNCGKCTIKERFQRIARKEIYQTIVLLSLKSSILHLSRDCVMV